MLTKTQIKLAALSEIPMVDDWPSLERFARKIERLTLENSEISAEPLKPWTHSRVEELLDELYDLVPGLRRM